jgi:NhaB family Na+:H+ antiporter
LTDYDKDVEANLTTQDKVELAIQGLIAVWLVVGLASHLAAVGLIGLSIIVLTTSMGGVIDEKSIGKAFEEASPFTALLCVFSGIVAVIIDQGLFSPVIN